MKSTRVKGMFKLAIVLSVLLVAATGCDLYQAINIGWSINGLTPIGGFTRVSYTVQNLGKYDLTGVNLKIGVDVLGNGTYPAAQWTPDFSISQGQVLYGSIDIVTGGAPLGGAMVLGVDMDNPKGAMVRTVEMDNPKHQAAR
jgi:hypothetical protein